jgi:hypothetical protein
MMMWQYEKLIGAFGQNPEFVVMWVMSNGTHEMLGSVTDTYPPQDHMFRHACG